MQNVGSLDRTIRIALGVVLLAIALLPPLAGFSVLAGLGAWKWLLAAVGAIMVLTGTVRMCPVYSILGINTRRTT